MINFYILYKIYSFYILFLKREVLSDARIELITKSEYGFEVNIM